MSHLLELLGRGLESDIGDILDSHYWVPQANSLESIQARCDKNPDWPDLQFKVGLANLRAVRIEDAIEHLLCACELKSDYAVARLALASAYGDMGQIDKALEQLEFANQQRPGEVSVLFAMGFCHERLGDSRLAIRFYQDAIECDDTFSAARERLAAVCLVTNDIDGAIEQYTELRDLQPQITHTRIALAHMYYRAGMYDQAVGEYETAIALEPENWSLVDDQVEALVASGQVRQAIERLEWLIDRQGDFPDLHVRLADLYNQVGDSDAAVMHYHEAIALQPNYLEAFVKLGTFHLIAGRWEQAADAFHEAAQLNENVLLTYVGLGVSQMAAGKKADAMNSFELALSVEPNSSLLLTEMSRLQLKSAMADEYLRGFDEDEDVASANVSLDNEMLLKKQLQMHADEVSRNGHQADVRYRYGVLLRAEDRQKEALEQFQQAVNINPTYVQALIKLGICQQDLGMGTEAIETFTRVLDVQPEYIDLHYRLGLLHTDRREFEVAVKEMEQAAKETPNCEPVRAGLALCLQNMGLMDKAAATWRSLWKIHSAAGTEQ